LLCRAQDATPDIERLSVDHLLTKGSCWCYTGADGAKSVGCGMITKELLEKTIRGVILEFKQTKRIPDPAADELTAALEARVDALFDHDAVFSYADVEDSARYVEQLRDRAQLESAEAFLQEIVAWQEMRS
jgi:hypothetical protein